jgi:hypothetical protein
MESYRLKIKIGNHEFEAEGPAEIVQQQFAEFRELLTAVPPKPEAEQPETAPRQEAADNSAPLPHLPLEKIMKVEGRVVSLTAKCDTVDEAITLALLGQKEFRSNQSVSGAEIMDGLKQSGYILPRIDKMLDKLSADGKVMTIGVRRSRRYRLTNQGLRFALQTAKELLETVA